MCSPSKGGARGMMQGWGPQPPPRLHAVVYTSSAKVCDHTKKHASSPGGKGNCNSSKPKHKPTLPLGATFKYPEESTALFCLQLRRYSNVCSYSQEILGYKKFVGKHVVNFHFSKIPIYSQVLKTSSFRNSYLRGGEGGKMTNRYFTKVISVVSGLFYKMVIILI